MIQDSFIQNFVFTRFPILAFQLHVTALAFIVLYLSLNRFLYGCTYVDTDPEPAIYDIQDPSQNPI